MVIVSCPAAGTQPTAGNWSGPRAQRNNLNWAYFTLFSISDGLFNLYVKYGGFHLRRPQPHVTGTILLPVGICGYP